MEGRAIFLDRDGTLIVNRHYLSNPAGVELLPGVSEALHRLVADGYCLFLFSNQSGVGRGMFTMDAVRACNDRMMELLKLPNPGFTEVCVAPEAPGQPIQYRKPSPRFILEMVAKHALRPEETWMVGDGPSDVLAGRNAGVKTVLIQRDTGPDTAEGYDWRCQDLPEFYSKLTGKQA
jgi:D-glycero-D-manno-heptose 1,7-bisphosphate phosphatase